MSATGRHHHVVYDDHRREHDINDYDDFGRDDHYGDPAAHDDSAEHDVADYHCSGLDIDIHHVVGPGDIIKYDDTEYVLVRRDDFDNLARHLNEYEHRSDDDRRVYYDVAALNAAADLVYGARPAVADDPVKR